MAGRGWVGSEARRLARASLLATALVLGGGAAQAAAQDEEPRLVMVTAQTPAEIAQLEGSYDVGYVGEPTEAAVYLDDEQEAQLRALGYTIGETIADRNTWLERKAEIAATDEREALAAQFAEDGAPKKATVVKGKRVVPIPGETVIMNAYTFTNYAGRFLYVEAHNKAVTSNGGPTLTMSYAGTDGVFKVGGSMGGNSGQRADSDNNKIVDQGIYQYNRILFALRGADANLAASDITVRVAASSGSADTSKVTEWTNAGLPPRVAGFQKDFITKYMDPTESYGRLDQLAAQFPDIAEIVHLPEDTAGYQRRAMAMMAGTTAPGSNPSTANQPLAVQLFSKAMGHLGGNQITAEFKNPGTADAPLSVAVTGSDIVVSLATNATGALASTAKQVVDAINADPAASALVNAYTYANNAGAGIVPVRAKVTLSDFLNAPPSVQRGPFDMRMLRIGKQRDGSKVGVFIYCQQHAREWVTPITCVETAERLVRNYATDPTTKSYVDNLDIFIIPSVNPDGGHASFYDNPGQRKNMVDYCPITAANGAIGGRNSWGVDLNRNNGTGSIFDGYFGADSSCSGETFSGPSENSEAEIRNEHWVVDTYSNIKFAINIHTHGGYFMWAPGAYIANGRVTLPAPNIGIEKYFFQVADDILSHIKSSRNTVILPNRTGPIADVLYSAAGNSADDQYYRKGIIAYSFEAGAQRLSVNQTTGAITRTDVGFQPCFQNASPPAGFSSTSCGTPANPNPLLASEGHDSAMEFAEGNFGLLQGALEYSQDVSPPVTNIDSDNVTVSKDPINYRFNWPGEAAVIRYTTDGSTPTAASTAYENQGARKPGQVLTVSAPGTTTVKWFGTDIKGNVEATRSQTFLIDQTAPAITIGTPAEGAVYTQGKPVTAAFSCTDEGGAGVADCTGTTANGALLPTDTPGTFTFTVTAHDAAGNETVATRSYTVIPAVNTDGTVGGTVGATLALTIAGPATFGTFTPGADRNYTAGTTAKVISSAGNAALSVSDPGKLTNGSFSLAEPLVVELAPASWTGPVSNGSVAITFRQHIGANDPLRTGSYSKTLTFTLSTTAP